MVFDILKFLFICLEVVLLFNLLILVHEWGHYLAARWRGLVVEKFAIWFGKPLWSKTINGVEYRLGSIPAGGYVAIPQLAPMEALEGRVETDRATLPAVKPLDKIIVAAAGPLFSLGLAFVMATAVYFIGKPENEINAPVIGEVTKGGPAEKAGLKPGDEVLEVDGHPVSRFFGGTDSIQWRIIRSEAPTIPFKIKRDGQVLTIDSEWVKPETASWRRPALRQVQIGPLVKPGISFVVRGTPAEKAGLQAKDLILEANGTKLRSLPYLAPIIQGNLGKPISLLVERGSETIPLTMDIPVASSGNAEAIPNLGIEWGRINITHPYPWTQVGEAATSIFRMVGALFSAKSDVKAAHFSGPVGIMKLYYQVFETDFGWQLALSLSVLINVNLALLNLLPFPVLDGGHIMLAIIEGIRRKPINIRVLEVVQTGCAMLLIGFMIYVTFFDIGDFVPQKSEAKKEAVEPAK